MTQTSGSSPPPARRPGLLPITGMTVRLRTSPEVGVVAPTDDWWDSLLIRGVDISEQVLVEWRRNGLPVRTWERVSQLEEVLSPPSGQMQAVTEKDAEQ